MGALVVPRQNVAKVVAQALEMNPMRLCVELCAISFGNFLLLWCLLASRSADGLGRRFRVDICRQCLT